ncbi:MAG: DUF3048 domain-containing protein [Christensenellales bacterium]|jgi:hypothetical protein
MSKRFGAVILALMLLLSLAACSADVPASTQILATPSKTSPPPSPSPQATASADPVRSKTTGLPYSGVYQPVAVMVENGTDARPQSGLSQADFVYEVYKESGTVRLLAIFSDNAPEKVGPMRSARWPFLEIAREWDCAFGFFGGPEGKHTANIYDKIRSVGLKLPLDGITELGKLYWRSDDRPRPDNAYSSIVTMRERYNYQPTQHTTLFSADKTYSGTTAHKITLPWEAISYQAEFTYDDSSGLYLRSYRDKPLTDAETGEQVSVKNFIVQYAERYSLGSPYVSMKMVGSGKADVFIEGKRIAATWERASMDSQTIFYDENGKEFEFRPGNTWISVFPSNESHKKITVE